jgi:4-methyl-5(b-hydroxyethyl)-thiazole monophosphate biosynthesis
MIKLAVFVADGAEELEMITPVDILRRCDGVTVDTVSVCGKTIKTSHGVSVLPDKMVEEVDLSTYDGYIIPGGMPGATNIAASKSAIFAIKNAEKENKLIAAICASPAVVLASNGVKKGANITCYPAPAFIEMLNGYNYTAEDVTMDGNLITANGPRAAFNFAKAICEYFNLKPKF